MTYEEAVQEAQRRWGNGDAHLLPLVGCVVTKAGEAMGSGRTWEAAFADAEGRAPKEELMSEFRERAVKDDEYVAWLRWTGYTNSGRHLVLCDSDDAGAFKVYRHPAPSETVLQQAQTIAEQARRIAELERQRDSVSCDCGAGGEPCDPKCSCKCHLERAIALERKEHMITATNAINYREKSEQQLNTARHAVAQLMKIAGAYRQQDQHHAHYCRDGVLYPGLGQQDDRCTTCKAYDALAKDQQEGK